MMTLTSSPRLIKGGLAVLAPGGAVRRLIALQYNPDALTRSYQVQGAGADSGGERAQPFHLKGSAIETITLEAEIGVTDQVEFPGRNPKALAFGTAPQLAALERGALAEALREKLGRHLPESDFFQHLSSHRDVARFDAGQIPIEFQAKSTRGRVQAAHGIVQRMKS